MPSFMVLIYFFYGLAFFSMGLVIMQEVGRCSDLRLRQALLFLAAFGFLHGSHEWYEMFHLLDAIRPTNSNTVELARLVLLGFSFLSLATFGSLLLALKPEYRRLNLIIPLTLAALWSFGLLLLRGIYPPQTMLWSIADVWTRYVLAIPSSLLACLGLVIQQRQFRQAGLAQFGQDSLWAAVAFAWYGLIGQIFVRPSPLPPSDIINSALFFSIFGFPIQLLRAVSAAAAAFFVVRFMRSFEVETQRNIDELKAARLEEAQRREAVYSELLRRVVAAQEAERQRVARELHDETGQALTALGLGLRGVNTMLRSDPKKASHNLQQLEGLVAGSLNELQRLIADLRPSHLDDLGLPAALRWYAGEIHKRTGLTVNVDLHGEPGELAVEEKTALFRVAQEALTNVIKHAHASCVNISLYYDICGVTLQVEDDGRGFDPGIMRSTTRSSWGLLGMEERATLLGGRLTIQSALGVGTRVQVVIPHMRQEEVIDEHTFTSG